MPCLIQSRPLCLNPLPEQRHEDHRCQDATLRDAACEAAGRRQHAPRVRLDGRPGRVRRLGRGRHRRRGRRARRGVGHRGDVEPDRGPRPQGRPGAVAADGGRVVQGRQRGRGELGDMRPRRRALGPEGEAERRAGLEDARRVVEEGARLRQRHRHVPGRRRDGRVLQAAGGEGRVRRQAQGRHRPRVRRAQDRRHEGGAGDLRQAGGA